MKKHLLPFFNERQTPIDVLMFHCSAQNTSGMLSILEQENLSCHYIIDTDGSITKVVPEDKRAWHGGNGYWREIKTDINSHSVGIELSSLSMGQKSYPQIQIDSLIKLSKRIIRRYKIKPQNIIGHSDASPTRKPDPGKAFPWEYLAQKGIGLWYDINDISKAPTDDIRFLLSGIGYDTRDDESFCASQYAFARRFFPSLIADDNNIDHLIKNVCPKKTNFQKNKKYVATAQAVYVRFNS